MVIDEGQQYGTDREIAVISLLRQQPLVLWTADSEQTPGDIARTAPNAKRSRQLLLAKKHGLRSDRNYYMPSNLADAMIRLFDGSSNEGLSTLSQILRRGQHTLGQLWTNQLSPQSTEDLEAANAVLPDLRAQFEAAQPHEQKQLPQSWTPNYWQAQQSTFHDPWYAGVSDLHAWGLMLPSSSRVSPVTYHSVVAVRYPDLCRLINDMWELGSFVSGGLPDRPPGFQFVLWDTNARINDRSLLAQAFVAPLVLIARSAIRHQFAHQGDSQTLIVCLLFCFTSNDWPRNGEPRPRVPGVRGFPSLANPVDTFCTPCPDSIHYFRLVTWHLTPGYRLFRVKPAPACYNSL